MNLLTLPSPLVTHLRASDWRILITGASGWLGQAALELLHTALGPMFDRRVVAFGSAARALTLREGSTVLLRALTDLPSLPNHPSLLLHFAYLTREKTGQMTADAYIRSNRALSQLAAEGGAAVGVERAFLTSSGAVYAAMAAPESADPSLLYGRLKLEDETLFRVFAYSAPSHHVFVTRLFNLSGPYINKLDSYALSSIILHACRGNIQIHAQRPVIRSYTSVENLLGVAFGQLLRDDPEPWLCMDTAGECEVEMATLAQVVRKEIAPEAHIDRAELTTMIPDRYVGDGSRYQALLQLLSIRAHPLPQQIVDTAEYLRHRVFASPDA